MNLPPPPVPKISCVIPMYNAEKFIGACLTSILGQTFQDFEIIIVNDCSTDTGVEVVESFIPKFGGRLKIIANEKNSGPGVASQKGVDVSRGKYVYVPDNDDLITVNAFEKLYDFAEKFQADAVFTDRGFLFEKNSDKLFPDTEDLFPVFWQQNLSVVDEPAFESDDIAERLEKFLNVRTGFAAWQKFVRRDLLVENKISFPPLRTSADIVWTVQLLCAAKKILYVPFPFYIYRQHPESVMHKERTPEEILKFFMNVNVEGIKFLSKFFDRQKFFSDNPEYRWKLLEFFWRVHMVNHILKPAIKMQRYEIFEILKSCFAGKNFDGDLIALLCALTTSEKIENLTLQGKIDALQKKS